MSTQTYNCTADELIDACALLFPSGGSFELVAGHPTVKARSPEFVFPTSAEVADAVTSANQKRAEVNAWQIALTAGYFDADTGIKLKTTPNAQQQFTAFSALMREGLELGAISNETMQTVWDYSDASHQLTTLQTRGLLFRYGVHCKTLFDALAP
jgi:hypothetical protein